MVNRVKFQFCFHFFLLSFCTIYFTFFFRLNSGKKEIEKFEELKQQKIKSQESLKKRREEIVKLKEELTTIKNKRREKFQKIDAQKNRIKELIGFKLKYEVRMNQNLENENEESDEERLDRNMERMEDNDLHSMNEHNGYGTETTEALSHIDNNQISQTHLILGRDLNSNVDDISIFDEMSVISNDPIDNDFDAQML